MHRDDPPVAQRFGGFERGVHLDRVVGVIVHDHSAVALALDLEPAAHTAEGFRRALGILRFQAQRVHAAAHGQRVINVMVAGHIEPDMGKGFAQFQHVELVKAGLVFRHMDSAEVGFLPDAEAEHRPVDGVHHVHRVVVVHVKGHRAGKQGELLERQFELAHRAVIFQMVVVNVQDHTHRTGQVQEGFVVFAGFDDDVLPVARLAVAADQRQFAADHSSRVTTGQFQHGGDHAAGRGLAVGTGHAHAARVQAAEIPQHDAALHRLDAARVGGLDLGVIGVDRRAVHHELRVAHVGRVMADGDLHAQRTLRLGIFGLLHVRAGDPVPAAVQDLDQRIRAGTAAADKMDGFHTVQKFGVEHIECRCHRSSPQERFVPSSRHVLHIMLFIIIFFLHEINTFPKFLV